LPELDASPNLENDMRLSFAVAFLLAACGAAVALDLDTRPVGPVLAWEASSLARFDPAWVHVKFREGAQVSVAGGHFVGREAAAANAVLAGALEIRRTFAGDPATMRAWKLQGEAASGRVGPDLSLWFDVRLPDDRASLAATLNALNALPDVEIAHPAAMCEPAVVVAGPAPKAVAADLRLPTPNFAGQQGYLYATPVGLDATSAWAVAGGRGNGMQFIDVELAWIWSHEDFGQLSHFYQGGVGSAGYEDHGTAVLGEIIGANNGFGVTGFASETAWGTEGVTEGEWPTVPQYFLEAAQALRPGDVWLIELQMYPPGRGATPMEWLQVNYDAIWTSCWSLGVVCIEAGANGQENLDASYWNGVFNRNLRDSGAVMVGAGTPTGRVAEWYTNYGSRIDVHAWGSSIVTTGYGDLYNGGSTRSEYTATFSGTSGASPMIAGSALCLQGIARANLGEPLTPLALRQLLHDTGIAHLDPVKNIGPRPDLGAAVEQLLSLTPVEEPVVTGGLTLLGARSPFAGETVVRFSRAQAGPSRLVIYDVAGRRVRTVDGAATAAGTGQIRWDGRDDRGREVSGGVYVLRLAAGGEVVTGRVVKVR
jgi:serine protease